MGLGFKVWWSGHVLISRMPRFKCATFALTHWQDFLSLFIFLEVSWEKEEEMRRF